MARQPREGYIKKQIRERGVNFIQTKTPAMLSGDVVRIFRDMSFGNFDPSVEGPYLKDPMLNETCINVANGKIMYYQTIVAALDMYLAQLKSTNTFVPGMEHIYVMNMNSLKAWSLIYNACVQLKSNPDYVGTLIALMNQLVPLKGSIYSNKQLQQINKGKGDTYEECSFSKRKTKSFKS